MSEASEPRMPNLLVDREYVVMKSDRGGMNGLIAEDWVTLYHACQTMSAELAAAIERAEKAERALRLEQGRPAEGDLPPGWTQNTRRRDGRWYLLDYHADVWEQNEGWHWAIHGDGTPHHAASAAEAIDAAQAALEGGDDE